MELAIAKVLRELWESLLNVRPAVTCMIFTAVCKQILCETEDRLLCLSVCITHQKKVNIRWCVEVGLKPRDCHTCW